jgi:hypothetical protein
MEGKFLQRLSFVLPNKEVVNRKDQSRKFNVRSFSFLALLCFAILQPKVFGEKKKKA